MYKLVLLAILSILVLILSSCNLSGFSTDEVDSAAELRNARSNCYQSGADCWMVTPSSN